MSRPLLWDVDTQVDFVRAGAKLPVPGAEEAAPAMARLVRWAAEHGLTHLATADDHELTDPEISAAPDYEATYPPHCLRGTPGAAKIPETAQLDPLPISATRSIPRRPARTCRSIPSSSRQLFSNASASATAFARATSGGSVTAWRRRPRRSS